MARAWLSASRTGPGDGPLVTGARALYVPAGRAPAGLLVTRSGNQPQVSDLGLVCRPVQVGGRRGGYQERASCALSCQ